MEEQKFSFSESFDKSKEYLETQVELLKLKALSRMSRIVGSLIVDGSKLLLTLLVVFFWSLALGFYLGEVLGSYSLGFLATGGLFLVIILLIRAFEPKLEAKFMDFTIRRVVSKWKEEDDKDEEAMHAADMSEGGSPVADPEPVVETEQEDKERV
ncbi:hypothetical protein [Sphingobacterium humi]|uniref:hypothetical protein n=1 Tax=Sphingobacterium humi TaxID=1796905 RepID=UPI001BAFDE39|nr:hypothetical protein [Sphingobacterium humi]